MTETRARRAARAAKCWAATGWALWALTGCITEISHPVDLGDFRVPDDAWLRGDARGPERADMAAPGDAAPGGERDAELDGAVLDGAVLDAAPDAGPPDAAPPDAMPDADPGPDAFVPRDIDAPCAPRPIATDMPGDYVLWPAPPGRVAWAGDPDGDGRGEVHALIAAGLSGRDAEQIRQSRRFSVIEWVDGALVERGTTEGVEAILAVLPRAAEPTLVTKIYHVLRPADPVVSSALALRVDGPAGPLRYDLEVEQIGVAPGTPNDYFETWQAAVADDGAGPPEILTGNGALLAWQAGRYARRWWVSDIDPRDDDRAQGGDSTGVALADDFDGDGRLDLVLVERAGLGLRADGSRYGRQRARLIERDDRGVHRVRARLPAGAYAQWIFAAGDLDGDGAAELLVPDSPADCTRVVLWTSTGDDTYRRSAHIDHVRARSPLDLHSAVFADLDGDGDDELVLSLGEVITAWDWRDDALTQVLGVPHCSVDRTCAASPVYATDLDGDGRAEIVYSEMSNDEVLRDAWQSPTGVRVLGLAR